MIILNNREFNFFKECIVTSVYAEVNRLEFDCLCGLEDSNTIIQVKNEETNETAPAKILVMMRRRVCFSDNEKAKIAIELRPSKKKSDYKFYSGIRFYRYPNLTD